MRVLVTGGCGFVGSHAVDVLVSRGHDVLIQDDLSTAELDEDGEGPLHLNQKARFAASFPPADLREVGAVLHLALRHPLEWERAVWSMAFEGYVVSGVRLLLELLDLRAPVSRFVLTGPLRRGPGRHAEANLVGSLRDLLSNWHRPPILGVYCAWLPELIGCRRTAPLPDGVNSGTPVEVAARFLANLTDGWLPHHLSLDVALPPGLEEVRGG